MTKVSSTGTLLLYFTEQPKALTINPQKGIIILYIKRGLIKITINKIGPIKIKVIAAKK